MSFKHPTFIVLDLPDHISDKILEIRKENQDEFRLALPAEITLTGSSGVGIISEEQNDIAKTTKPIKVSFDQVKRFPETDIFVLKLNEESKIRELHERLKDSGIKYEDNPFKFEPHCTLRSRSPVTLAEEEKLYKLKIDEEFEISSISVYTLEKLPIKKLYTLDLLG